MIKMLSPSFALQLANAILFLHTAIVFFVVFLPPLIWFGAWRKWRWVRHYWLRLTHLCIIAFVAIQTLLGYLCPLTIWENALREHAGQASYGQSFIEAWLSRLIFFHAPNWIFISAYLGYAVLIIATWWLVPPSRIRRSA